MNVSPSELNRRPFGRGIRLSVLWSVLLCVALLTGGFLGGVAVQRVIFDSGDRDQFADLNAAYRVIEENYYYYPTTDEERTQLASDMESGAIVGALGSLDDAYTRYLDIDDSQTAQEGLEGKYGGVGIDVEMEGDITFVGSVVPDSPADDGGIVRGDVIEQINGDRIETDDANAVLRLLRGEIGSSVSITFVRPSTGNVFSQDLTLEEIVVPPVTLEFIEGTTYAWLRITLFGDTTVADLDAAIVQIKERGSTGVILDLRGNSGGWVVAARQTLGRFLDPSLGPAMFEDTRLEGDGMSEMPVEGAEGLEPLDLPLVVLIDGGTASAAEIVAGALKDYNRALLVGETTFGKGSVQRIYEFSDGSTIRVTIAEWFTPSRSRIQSEGIRPDVEVSTSMHTAEVDPILATSIVVLDSQIKDIAATPVSEEVGN